MAEKKIKEKILEIIERYGGIDGGHHKQWVLDQIVRIIHKCPLAECSNIDCNGNKYYFKDLGKSEEYKLWVKNHKDGEDGPDTYDWEEGIAP